ncbi:MAG TPA: ATP-binding protein [Verrucomicrobiae bacterium]|jgi:signal transduction histidine kinase|nr:ATP-binding protein [Verrucomicrobiae bacterium]
MSDEINRRALVIDDNPAIHEDFRKILGPPEHDSKTVSQMEGALFGAADSLPAASCFQVDCATQGQEGLERLKQACARGERYALAFVDVRMPPGWDGIETAAHLWAVDPDLQIVICTAYSDYSWNEMTAKLGHSDRLIILKKPFDNIEVTQMAETLAHKWHLLQEAKQRVHDLEALAEERTAELTVANQSLRSQIEERTRSERERQMLEVQLRHAQKLEAIGHLAAGIAHEINTPAQYVGDNARFLDDSHRQISKVLESHRVLLQAVKQQTATPGLVSSAEEILNGSDLDYLSEQIPSAIKATIEGVDRISKIVRAMKEFSHPGSKEKILADVNRAIETTVTVARNEWKYVAEMRLELESDLPLTPCFVGEFNQTILNLIVNAAQAIREVLAAQPGGKGTITVRTRRAGDSVEVSVRDTGAGIPEAIRSRIFEPFFTTKEVGTGTGQGLAIVYACVVKHHGGTIRFDSEVGQGSNFILTLPISPLPLISEVNSADV